MSQNASSHAIKQNSPLFTRFRSLIYSPVRSSRQSSLTLNFFLCHRTTKRPRFARNLNSMTPSTSFPRNHLHHVDHPKQVHLGEQQTRALKALGRTLVPTRPINATSPLKDSRGKALAF